MLMSEYKVIDTKKQNRIIQFAYFIFESDEHTKHTNKKYLLF